MQRTKNSIHDPSALSLIWLWLCVAEWQVKIKYNLIYFASWSLFHTFHSSSISLCTKVSLWTNNKYRLDHTPLSTLITKQKPYTPFFHSYKWIGRRRYIWDWDGCSCFSVEVEIGRNTCKSTANIMNSVDILHSLLNEAPQMNYWVLAQEKWKRAKV